jgi:hypothetical protein
MPDHKVAIINVGSNTSHGSLRSPLFSDHAFEFVPIPDDQVEGLPTYADFKTQGNRAGSEFIPQSFLSRTMHDDPEFVSNTYGDHPETVLRAINLRKLNKGDSLFYLARLVEWDEQKGWGRGSFYLIGELVLDRVVKKSDLVADSQLVNTVKNNAHVKRWLARPDMGHDNFWVFVGSGESKRFVHAVPFGLDIAQKVMLSSQGTVIVRDEGKTENQVIGSYARACRLIEDSSRIELLREHISKHCCNP